MRPSGFGDIFFRLQDEAGQIARILREKGFGHFRLALLAIAAALLSCYLLVYRTTEGKLGGLQEQIRAEKFRAEHAADYDALRSKMAGYYRRMPKPESKDGWLFNKILDSAKKQGIVLDSIGSQSEWGNGEVWVLSIPVTAHLEFGPLAKWIESLENEKPALFITGLQVQRTERRGSDRKIHVVQMEITTATPKKVQRL